ncbi:MAG TPA: hypothetical protein VJT54_04965 [Verrucomicrobiae bacterium]|nr:hypothetical protein [Verrucomicrobiae bacterium]
MNKAQKYEGERFAISGGLVKGSATTELKAPKAVGSGGGSGIMVNSSYLAGRNLLALHTSARLVQHHNGKHLLEPVENTRVMVGNYFFCNAALVAV